MFALLLSLLDDVVFHFGTAINAINNLKFNSLKLYLLYIFYDFCPPLRPFKRHSLQFLKNLNLKFKRPDKGPFFIRYPLLERQELSPSWQRNNF